MNAQAESVLTPRQLDALIDPYEERLVWLESHNVAARLKIIGEACSALGPQVGWYFLGQEWTYLETTKPALPWLLSVSKPAHLRRVQRWFMSPTERTAFEKLPATIQCWRGGGRDDVLSGISWSLSRAIAERFARYACGGRRTLFGMATKNPVVVSAMFKKSKVFAVKLEAAP